MEENSWLVETQLRRHWEGFFSMGSSAQPFGRLRRLEGSVARNSRKTYSLRRSVPSLPGKPRPAWEISASFPPWVLLGSDYSGLGLLDSAD